MLNYETLLSNYDDKLTLMQWLKKVEDALKDASAVSFDVVNLGNATFKFKIVFEDGSEIESDPIVINKGDSVASAAIVNGELILTLTNGDTIDAGNMFDGDVNITGTLDVGNDVSVNGDIGAGIITGSKLQSTGDISASGSITGGEIVENMTGYSFQEGTPTDFTLDYAYVGVVKNGNKVTLVNCFSITPTAAITATSIGVGRFLMPSAVLNKIIPASGAATGAVAGFSVKGLKLSGGSAIANAVDLVTGIVKYDANSVYTYLYQLANMSVNETYFVRIEATFLLGDNLAA